MIVGGDGDIGHERGAFTGAMTQKKGNLEIADGGTVFLDEVGELAPALQSKLLRALELREFERVGGTRPVRIDIRLISATNRRLPDDVAAGRFRSDLYDRLHVVDIELPPLRERREDIAALATHFVERFARKSARPIRGIAADALKYLTAHDWPGNIRELENTIERAIVLGVSDYIKRDDLPDALLQRPAQVMSKVRGSTAPFAKRRLMSLSRPSVRGIAATRRRRACLACIRIISIV